MKNLTLLEQYKQIKKWRKITLFALLVMYLIMAIVLSIKYPQMPYIILIPIVLAIFTTVAYGIVIRYLNKKIAELEDDSNSDKI